MYSFYVKAKLFAKLLCPLCTSVHAHVEAELEQKKAADEIKQEMVGLAMDAAGKFVRVSMDDRTKNALIEETLAEIGENTWLS